MNAEHLYIHVPFCTRRCVYCDFSIAVRTRIPVEDYITALEREWSVRHVESQLDLSTLYLGGGTPSKLGGEGVARLMDFVNRRTRLRPDAEVTLEANPEDVSRASVRAWRSAGVNRVSLGVQSFDDHVLAWMHRTHDAAAARNAIRVLREEDLRNLSIDLIFATPTSVPRSWQSDLEQALELDLPHVSVYGLTVEPRTPLGRRIARSDLAEAPEESFEREYLQASASFMSSGLEHYEVSNYGRPDQHSRHNWAYWTRSPYAGLGPAAHEFDGTARRWNTEAYAQWVAHLSLGRDAIGGCEQLTREQTGAEVVYLSLRTNAGLTIGPAERGHAGRWVDEGWAEIDADSTLHLTASGWLRLDSIANALTMLRSRY